MIECEYEWKWYGYGHACTIWIWFIRRKLNWNSITNKFKSIYPENWLHNSLNPWHVRVLNLYRPAIHTYTHAATTIIIIIIIVEKQIHFDEIIHTIRMIWPQCIHTRLRYYYLISQIKCISMHQRQNPSFHFASSRSKYTNAQCSMFHVGSMFRFYSHVSFHLSILLCSTQARTPSPSLPSLLWYTRARRFHLIN